MKPGLIHGGMKIDIVRLIFMRTLMPLPLSLPPASAPQASSGRPSVKRVEGYLADLD
jgi:hypothetical protein